jgi:hypothetical protein
VAISDELKAIAQEQAAVIGNTDFVKQVFSGAVSSQRYHGFITAMLPVVLGFTVALNEMIERFDPTIPVRLVNNLKRQSREEVRHNSLWKDMCAHFGIEHERAYRDFLSYKRQLETQKLWQRLAVEYWVLWQERGEMQAGIYPKPIFPEAVLALAARMEATSAQRDPFVHYAAQATMEQMILTFTTEWIYPGLLRSPLGSHIEWWKEHYGKVQKGAKPPAELRHVRAAFAVLDRNIHSGLTAVANEARQTASLFAATFVCHDHQMFPVEKYKL